MEKKTGQTHEQTRERNAKFAELAQEPEVKKYLDNMPKSTHISYLRKLCQEKYGFTVPASAAYKVMATIDDRFKPKHRKTETFPEKNSEELEQNSVELEHNSEVPVVAVPHLRGWTESVVAPAADVADDE